jgi:hypothetical protein
MAGVVLIRRPETANGLVFITIEDETGIANLIHQVRRQPHHRWTAPCIAPRLPPADEEATLLFENQRLCRRHNIANLLCRRDAGK